MLNLLKLNRASINLKDFVEEPLQSNAASASIGTIGCIITFSIWINVLGMRDLCVCP